MSEDLRQSTGDHRQALKAAVRRAIKIAGGGRSVEQATRVNHASLSRYGLPEHPKDHCPLDVALDLDLEAGQPIILAAMAEAQGYDIAKRDPMARSEMPWCSEVAKIASMAGIVQTEIAQALVDQKFDAAEERCIVEKIDETIASLRATKERVQAERIGR